MQNVTVELLDGSGNVVATTTTDSDGGYSFAGLDPADYTVRETDPSGYISTTDNDASVTVSPGGAGIANFGDHEQGAITGIVFNDANGNGVRDSGEPGIGNVVVRLLDGNGDPVAETVTSAVGAYSFGGLTPGAYTVIETDPEGFFSITNNTIGATLPLGGNAVVDFADIESGRVVGAVFEDLNGDGVQGPGEAGLPGVVVDIIGVDGEIVQSVETNEDGGYGFSNVEPGSYTVRETDPAGYASTTLNTVPVNLAAGGAATADFGDIQAGTISGVVFNDIDGNGVQDPGESGVGGATVELVNADGEVIATAETDENGNYTFPDVLPGSYTVRETDPDGFGSATGNDRPVNVPSGGSAVANFGDGETGTVSGAVFNDINGNGVKDAGEAGLSGVRVALVDADGTFVGTVDTGSDGTYAFTDVAPGAYTVREIDPEGFASTTLNSVPVNLISGGTASASFGDIQAGTVSGVVFNDVNGNGIQDPGETGVGGVSVDLVDADGNVIDTVVTADDGAYVFPSVPPGDYTVQENDPDGFGSATGNTRPVTVPPGGSAVANFGDGQAGTISGAVFNDANGSGVQDAGETGIAGVTVVLEDGDGVEIATAVTTAGGFFAFTEILPGAYTVLETDPDGFTSTTLNAVPVNLVSGGTAAVGFGDIPTGTISGSVYNDLNGNGVQDPGEPGIGGVTVEILDASGQVVATVVTAEDGSYAVPDLPPGSYVVRETDPPGFASTTLNGVPVNMAPGGAAAVSFGDGQHGVVSGTVFNDGNGNGRQDPGETGLSGVSVELIDASGVAIMETATTAAGVFAFTDVLPGAYTVVETDPDGFVSTSPNAVPINLAPNGAATAGFGDVQTGSVSGVVFNDLNGDGVQGPGETGLGGVTVELVDGDGNVFSAVTANDGSYVFTGVPPGDYMVEEETPPGFQSTTGNALPVSVTAGEPAIANFGNGQSGVIGGEVFNDLNGNGIRDAGENGIGGVRVTLVGDDGSFIEETTTTVNGSYAFTGVQPGDYTVRETDPAGFASTTDNDVAVSLAPNGASAANFGDIGIGTVSGVVFNDADGDGIQDPGEAGVGGVTIQLIDADGQVVGQPAVTAGDGSYLFPQVPVGIYTITETVPDGYQPTTPSSVDEVQLDPGEGAAVNFGVQPETEEVLLPDLSNTTKMVVDVNGSALMPNDTLWYGVAIYNAGEGAAFNVVYTDDLPAGVTLVQREERDFVETTQGVVISGNAPGDTRIKVDLGAIPAGEGAVITYYVQIDDDTSAGKWLANQGAVDYEDIVGGAYHEPTDFPGTTALNDPTVIGPVADVIDDANLTAKKAATPSGPDVVQPGETIEYTVLLTNNGPGTARNVVFTDSAPLYTTFVAGSLTTDMGVIDEGPPLSVVIDTLEAGSTATIWFQAAVDGDAPPNAVLVNQGAITRNGGIAPLPVLTTPVKTVVASDEPAVEVYKSVIDLNPVNPGDIMEYVLTVVNTGTAATDVIVTDDVARTDELSLLPGSAYFENGQAPGWTVASDAGQVEAFVEDLGPGASAVIRFRARVSAEVDNGAILSNQATAEWPAPGENDEPSDDPVTIVEDDATAVVVVYDPTAFDPPSALKIGEGDGAVVRWTMTWINDKNEDALLVRVEDDVPEGVTYVEGSVDATFADTGFPAHINGVIVWEGAIPAGESVDIWYDTNVPEDINRVENQGRGYWDENGNGVIDPDELANPSPVVTDDPRTSAFPDDESVWSAPDCRLNVSGLVQIDPCFECLCDVPDPSPKPGASKIVPKDIQERVKGVNGVKVELFVDSDRNGAYSLGDVPVTFAPTVTKPDAEVQDGGKPGTDLGEQCIEDGYYAFDKLCAGTYVIRIAPDNFQPGGLLYGYVSAAGTNSALIDLRADSTPAAVGPFIFKRAGAPGPEAALADDDGGAGGGGCFIGASGGNGDSLSAVVRIGWLFLWPPILALIRMRRRG